MHAINVANPCSGAHVCASNFGADTDDVTSRSDVQPSAITHGDVIAASGVRRKRGSADRCVVCARGVAFERKSTSGRVAGAAVVLAAVVKERFITDGRVEEAGRVKIERLLANGRVFRAVGVTKKRPVANGRVITGSGIAKERFITDSRVFVAPDIVRKRLITDGRVFVAVSIVVERIGTNGSVKTAGGIAKERSSSNSGEVMAGGIHEEYPKTNGQVVVGVIVGQRLRPNSHVKVARSVAGK